jgi:hypothetical protein
LELGKKATPSSIFKLFFWQWGIGNRKWGMGKSLGNSREHLRAAKVKNGILSIAEGIPITDYPLPITNNTTH